MTRRTIITPMLPRFLAPALTTVDEVMPLPPDEAHHLRQVLRLGVGDTVGVFDGRGNEFIARVERTTRHGVHVRALERVRPAAESAVSVTLAPAALKGRQIDAVIRDATMLGVVVIQPIVTARTAASLAALRRGCVLERWRRIAVSSAKQCGRAVVPEVRHAVDVAGFAGADRSAVRLVLAEPDADVSGASRLGTLARTPMPTSLALAVGPEGGWADEDIRCFTTGGYAPMTLGSRTLRADAVPAVALAVLLSLWGEL